MTAHTIIFPVVMRPNFNDPAWREQHTRECRAQIGAQLAPPPRTRPLVAVDNTRAFCTARINLDAMTASVMTRDNFDRHLREFCTAFHDDVDPSAR